MGLGKVPPGCPECWGAPRVPRSFVVLGEVVPGHPWVLCAPWSGVVGAVWDPSPTAGGIWDLQCQAPFPCPLLGAFMDADMDPQAQVAPTKGSPQPRSPVAPRDGTGTGGPGGPQSSALELSVPLLGWVTTAQPPVTVPISVPSAPLPPARPGAATPHGALHLPRGARADFHPQKSPRTHRRSSCPHHRALGKAKAFLEIPKMSGRAQQHPRG